jgi:transposase
MREKAIGAIMSLHPRYVPDIPEETARVAKVVFRKGNPYMKMRDELGTFFTDDQFADLYPKDGHPRSRHGD